MFTKSHREKAFNNSEKLRVVDHIRTLDPEWKRTSKEWQKTMRLYDKKFSTVLSCINYDKAIEENDIDEVERCRKEIYAIVDEAYRDFSKEIESSEKGIRLIKTSIHPKLLDDKSIKLLLNCDRGCFLFENSLYYKPRTTNEWIQEPMVLIDTSLNRYADLFATLNALDIDKVANASSEIQTIITSSLGPIPETRLMDNTVLEYLALIGAQIITAKENNKNPSELLELALIKLAILRDYSVDLVSIDRTFLENSDATCGVKEYLKLVLEKPLTEDTATIKRLIGGGISHPNPCYEYAEVKKIIPIYSRNGSMGFNTILFALFQDYFPVGFGVDPLPVHLNYHNKASFLCARHDYDHVLKRVRLVKNNEPEFFKQCREIYFSLFEEIKTTKIDEITFKKELLMLFLIIYERAYSPNRDSSMSLKDVIVKTTTISSPTLNQEMRYNSARKKEGVRGLLRPSNPQNISEWWNKLGDRPAYLLGRNSIFCMDPVNPNESDNLSINKADSIEDLFPKEPDTLELASEEKIQLLRRSIEKKPFWLRQALKNESLENIDFIKPLQDLGYEFPSETIIKNKPWKTLNHLQAALLDILQGFEKRHPDLSLNSNTKPLTRIIR